MSSLIKFVKDFAQDEEGLTVVEYTVGAALLIAGLTLAAPWDQLGTILNGVIATADDVS